MKRTLTNRRKAAKAARRYGHYEDFMPGVGRCVRLRELLAQEGSAS